MSDFEKALAAEINRLKTQLARLVGMSTPATKRGRPAGKSKPTPAKPKRKSSPKLKALRQLQGQYMGHVRRLTTEQKAKISSIRETKGMKAAIAAAKKLASK